MRALARVRAVGSMWGQWRVNGGSMPGSCQGPARIVPVPGILARFPAAGGTRRPVEGRLSRCVGPSPVTPPPPCRFLQARRQKWQSGKVAGGRAGRRWGRPGGKSGNGKLAEVGNSRYGQCSIIHSCWDPLGANSTDVINASPAVSEGRNMYLRERSTDNTRETGGDFPNFSKGDSRVGKGHQCGPVLVLYHIQ